MNTVQNRSSQMIFVHADLDLYGLSPYEFRLYAHIARRRECFSSLQTTAKICKMSVRKAQYALKTLEKLGLVQKTVRKGKTDIYELTPRNCWKEPEYDTNLEAERNKVKASFAKSRASISRTINNENNEEELDF
ncbi:helix-turn-helix domain-containing protein [Aerosakkonemataceae cyanobacterium BLCC-F154]|uniref:Helix-turn-helix domain-containing protein n=1 Tax=Floridaenema fluviatile BLCC-F154 TaxID=3153640 RepID=A0ABV4Y783_9CYAN